MSASIGLTPDSAYLDWWRPTWQEVGLSYPWHENDKLATAATCCSIALTAKCQPFRPSQTLCGPTHVTCPFLVLQACPQVSTKRTRWLTQARPLAMWPTCVISITTDLNTFLRCPKSIGFWRWSLWKTKTKWYLGTHCLPAEITMIKLRQERVLLPHQVSHQNSRYSLFIRRSLSRSLSRNLSRNLRKSKLDSRLNLTSLKMRHILLGKDHVLLNSSEILVTHIMYRVTSR